MDKRTKIFIIIFALLALLGLLLYSFFAAERDNKLAVISLDGEEYRRIDLNRVRESYDIEIVTKYGSNTVHVQPGAIGVINADCPGKICVNRGMISEGGLSVACVPHRLVISIAGGDIDA